jgi:N-methylhydantoinase B
MDHGRVGPPGVFGGDPGMPNKIEIEINGRRSTPLHLSKDQDVLLREGDSITVRTPGGGGFGDPSKRDRELILRDLRRGYYDRQSIRDLFRVEID